MDYRELIQNPDVEIVFCAVPHNLHEEFYCAVVEAGKHLMGEKPFGIDSKANETIRRMRDSGGNCAEPPSLHGSA